jgi:hypothetical protein
MPMPDGQKVWVIVIEACPLNIDPSWTWAHGANRAFFHFIRLQLLAIAAWSRAAQGSGALLDVIVTATATEAPRMPDMDAHKATLRAVVQQNHLPAAGAGMGSSSAVGASASLVTTNHPAWQILRGRGQPYVRLVINLDDAGAAGLVELMGALRVNVRSGRIYSHAGESMFRRLRRAPGASNSSEVLRRTLIDALVQGPPPMALAAAECRADSVIAAVVYSDACNNRRAAYTTLRAALTVPGQPAPPRERVVAALAAQFQREDPELSSERANAQALQAANDVPPLAANNRADLQLPRTASSADTARARAQQRLRNASAEAEASNVSGSCCVVM